MAAMVGVRFKPSPSNGRPTAMGRVVVFEEAVVTTWRMMVAVRFSPYASTKGRAVNAAHRCSDHECTVNAVQRYRWMYGEHRTAHTTKANAPAALLHQSGRLDPSHHSSAKYRWPKQSPKQFFSKADQVGNCFLLASNTPPSSPICDLLFSQIMAGLDDEFEGESRLSDWANVSHFLFCFATRAKDGTVLFV